MFFLIRKYMDWLSDVLQLKHSECWYKVRVYDVKQHGGSRLLELYGYSLYKALATLYPGSFLSVKESTCNEQKMWIGSLGSSALHLTTFGMT